MRETGAEAPRFGDASTGPMFRMMLWACSGGWWRTRQLHPRLGPRGFAFILIDQYLKHRRKSRVAGTNGQMPAENRPFVKLLAARWLDQLAPGLVHASHFRLL